MLTFSSPWIPVVFLSLIALLARKLQGSWLAPSAFAGLIWSFYLVLPLSSISDPVSASTVWLIVGLVMSMQVAAFFFEDATLCKFRKPSSSVAALEPVAKRMLRLSLVFSCASLAGGFIFVGKGLRAENLPSTPEGFLTLAGLSYGVLFDGGADSWWFRLLRMWVCPAALLGGFAAALTKETRVKLLSLVPFISALFLGTALASRFGTGLAIICWFGGYLGMQAFRTGGNYRIGRKFLIAGGAAFLAAVAMYVSVGIVRGHDYSELSRGSELVRSNLWGYLAVFDDWVRTEDVHELGWGRYSVAGSLELAGIKTREAALDYEPIVLKSGIPSNIYTAFRGAIQDFSLPGTLFLCVIAGALAGSAYTKLCLGETAGIGMLSGYYAFLLFSPIVSILNYNAVILALAVGVLAFRIPRNRISPVKRLLAHSISSGITGRKA
jgi:oligosaccharide repeat unit polymerase